GAPRREAVINATGLFRTTRAHPSTQSTNHQTAVKLGAWRATKVQPQSWKELLAQLSRNTRAKRRKTSTHPVPPPAPPTHTTTSSSSARPNGKHSKSTAKPAVPTSISSKAWGPSPLPWASTPSRSQLFPRSSASRPDEGARTLDRRAFAIQMLALIKWVGSTIGRFLSRFDSL